jgi:hypothetical protein
VLLVDPRLAENPVFPEDRRDGSLAGAPHILLSHGHGDHAGHALALAQELAIPAAGIADLISLRTRHQGIRGSGFNAGGTVGLNGGKVTMVNASHSSSPEGPVCPVSGAAGRKEILQQTLCGIGTDTIVDFGGMVALRVAENPRPLRNTAGFGVGRAVVKPPDPRRRNGGRAHRAGFQRHVKVMPCKPFRPGRRAGRPDRQQFGMGCRVGQLPRAVALTGHNPAIRCHDDRPHGHFAARGGGARLGQGHVHMAAKTAHAP